MKAECSGSTSMVVENESKGSHSKIILSNILYVPGLPQRMLSTGQLRRAGGEYIESGLQRSLLVMPDKQTGIPLKQKGDFLWLTDSNHIPMTQETVKSATAYAPGGRETASASLIDWHEALGHTHPASILFLEQRGLIRITGEKSLDNFNCRVCKEAKSTLPHYQRGTRSIKRPGEVVHVDLVGPFEPDMEGNTYLMVFVDEATRFKSVFGLKTRDQAYKRLKTYQDGIQSIGATAECIRGDGAREFARSRTFRQELKNLSLRWETSPPYTHQQQGLVERAVRQIVEGGRAQLARAGLGNEYWFYACQDFTFRRNCLPHQSLGGDSPYERIHPGRKPRYQALRKFGQTAYVHVDKMRQGDFSRGARNKMRPRSERGILLGHAMGASAYVVHLPRLNKIVTSSAVAFDDIPSEVPFLVDRPDHWISPAHGIDDAISVAETEMVADVPNNEVQDGQSRNSAFDGRDIPRPRMNSRRDVSPDKPVEMREESAEEVEHPERTKKSTQDPNRGVIQDQLSTMFEDSDEECNFTLFMLADTGITIKDAMDGPDAKKWKDTIELEDQGLEDLKVITRGEYRVGIRPLNTK